MPDEEQACLCGILNSFVANYLVRQVMTTHLCSTTVEQLRAPKPLRGSVAFSEIADLSTHMAARRSVSCSIRLQAIVARAYRLTAAEFSHVLSTFPLIPESERLETLEEFIRCSAQ